MTMHARIEAKLREAFTPAHLEVINQSHHHGGSGTQTHFKVIVVADTFAGERLLSRHRRVNNLLTEELTQGVHALTIEALTPAQWTARGGAIRPSPPCMGGSKSD
ncbi:MAG TPA: BolA/IbaG family iron-sulfur metabolism protein [Nannocystis exedens]|nr:BolA/IbaG family iron-sulfur metabolism protein [Nannocystis exedens]